MRAHRVFHHSTDSVGRGGGVLLGAFDATSQTRTRKGAAHAASVCLETTTRKAGAPKRSTAAQRCKRSARLHAHASAAHRHVASSPQDHERDRTRRRARGPCPARTRRGTVVEDSGYDYYC